MKPVRVLRQNSVTCLADGLAMVFLGEPQIAGSLVGATKTPAEGRDWGAQPHRSPKVVQSYLCIPRPLVLETQGVCGPLDSPA